MIPLCLLFVLAFASEVNSLRVDLASYCVTCHSGDENRKICSLYLSIMDRMGVQLEHFGDADTRLARL